MYHYPTGLWQSKIVTLSNHLDSDIDPFVSVQFQIHGDPLVNYYPW